MLVQKPRFFFKEGLSVSLLPVPGTFFNKKVLPSSFGYIFVSTVRYNVSSAASITIICVNAIAPAFTVAHAHELSIYGRKKSS